MQKDNKNILATPIMFKDEEIKTLRALKKQSDKRIAELEHKCNQYSRLCAQHVKNLHKKQGEIWDLKKKITVLKDELHMAEKFIKMQD